MQFRICYSVTLIGYIGMDDQDIEKALRSLMFFPETIAQVEAWEEFNKNIGDPDKNLLHEMWTNIERELNNKCPSVSHFGAFS